MRHSLSRTLFSSLLVFLVSVAVLPAQTPAPAAETATQFYVKYRAAFDKAKKLEDILPMMSPARRKQIENEPAAKRAETFEMIKMIDTTKNIKVVKETRTAAGATLDVTGMQDGQKATGTITIVKEGTAWKLDGESWKSGNQ